jgi:hypothetical protein
VREEELSGIEPPPEPFAYMKTNPYWGIRSPAITMGFFFVIVLVGVWLAGMGVLQRFPLGSGIHWAPIVGGILWAAMGAGGTYVGIRRWRWKREYERVMGRSPW